MGTTVRGGAGNLPLELSSFVGRRHEVSEARRLLSAARLVTLTGTGGVGKTRLALRTAAEVRRAFRDGVWLTELGQLHDPALVAHTVAATLGLGEQPGRPTEASLTEYLAARRVLLVLDNCEHLVDACAALAATLLEACPDLRVLATSREPLGIRGEATLLVPSLAVPDPRRHHTRRELAGYSAVTLFADRAAAVVPGFGVTAGNQDAVVKICDRLDGLPLAIELAAVRLRALSPQQIAQRLSDRYQLLATTLRGAPTRQQTLRSCIEWSYDLCSAQERLLWARASVFAGGFELDAAEEICAGGSLAPEEVLDVVAALVGKSVLIRGEHDTGVRYRMLETVREFGQDKLRQAGGYPAMRERHTNWYERLVLRAEADWVSPRQVSWFARLDREHANVRVALDHCLTRPGEAEAALRMLAALFHFYWWGRSWGREGRHWLGQALALSPEPSPVRSRALLINSTLALADGDWGAATGATAEGCALAKELADTESSSLCGYVSGSAALYSGDLTGAITICEEALGALPPGSYLALRLNLLLMLAIAAGLAGDVERAVSWHEEMLAISEPAGECFHRSYALWALGLLAQQQGDLRRAAALQHSSLRLRHGLHDLTGTGWSVESLAWVEAADGRPERAAVLLGAADQLWDTLGRPLQSYQHLMPYHEGCERGARKSLGEKRFRAAFQRGRGMSTDGAIAYALNEEPPAAAPGGQAPRAAPGGQAPRPAPAAGEATVMAGAGGAAVTAVGPLTARERQVAGLVAEGLTNKQIAARLVIAQRTAEGHVENALAKLGFTSRAQLASWVASSGR
ncbi:MAG: LuxR family transcriptional regulator [Streptosporangiaceae bacterium]|nr:LuxR family transcriptional regulator [Streptosporangiaceae bacterium]MBV9856299.1 LuxR family transcriptional regulator [Streptosporangiaceae bacterium]